MSEEGTGGEVAPAEGTPETPPATVSAALGNEPGDVTVETPEGAPDWLASLSNEEKAYVASKGWDKEGKGVADILRSYRNVDRLRGHSADKLTKIPDWSNGEEVAEFHQRMGVPESAEGYETLEVETNLGGLDAEVLKGLSYKMQLLPHQHALFGQVAGEYLEGVAAAQREAKAASDAAEELELEREWGAILQENQTAAKRAVQRFGLDSETVDKIQASLGYKATMELLTKIGRGLGEHRRPEGEADEAPFGVTQEVAQERLKVLSKDKDFYEKRKSGDAAANKEWMDLRNIAFPLGENG